MTNTEIIEKARAIAREQNCTSNKNILEIALTLKEQEIKDLTMDRDD